MSEALCCSVLPASSAAAAVPVEVAAQMLKKGSALRSTCVLTGF